MSWRDDHQRARVCQALLDLVGLAHLWECGDSPAPTPAAIRWWREGAPLSSGETIIFRVAWDVWNGEGGATLGTLLSSLSPRLIEAIGRLLIAYSQGPHQVDEWIAEVPR